MEAIFASLGSFLCLKRAFGELVLRMCVLVCHWPLWVSKKVQLRTLSPLWERELVIPVWRPICSNCIDIFLSLCWARDGGSTLLCLACWPACCQGHCARTLMVFAHCTANAAFALALRQWSLLAWLIGEPPCALYALLHRSIPGPRYFVTKWRWLTGQATAVVKAHAQKKLKK